MSNFQVCDLDEFLENDAEFMSPDEFLASLPPQVEESVEIPEELIFHHSMLNESEKIVEGEITQMLRIAPGILPPVDSFPKSYKPEKPTKLPDVIENDRIPILLNEKYFKFHDNDDNDNEALDDHEEIARKIVNNLDGGGSSNSNGNRKKIGRSSRSNRDRASGIIKGDSNRSKNSSDDIEKRFRNVFINDTSDEDNCNVYSSPDSNTQDNPMAQQQQQTVKPQQQQYYNAWQLYEMKRGKK